MASVSETAKSGIEKVGKVAMGAIERGHEVKLKVKLKVSPRAKDYKRSKEG